MRNQMQLLYSISDPSVCFLPSAPFSIMWPTLIALFLQAWVIHSHSLWILCC